MERELTREEFEGVWSEILRLLPKVDAIDFKKMAGDVAGAPNPLTYLNCVPDTANGHSIALSALCEVNARPSVKTLRRDLRHYYRGPAKRFLSSTRRFPKRSTFSSV